MDNREMVTALFSTYIPMIEGWSRYEPKWSNEKITEFFALQIFPYIERSDTDPISIKIAAEDFAYYYRKYIDALEE